MSSPITYKHLWKIAIPVIISGIAQNVVTVTDTMFLGKLSSIALGAAGNAGIFYFILIYTGMGFTTGAQIIVGRRNGEENYQQIGRVFNHAIYFLLPVSILLFFFIRYLSPSFLQIITQSKAILSGANEFLSFRAFGVIFALLNFVFIAFYVGIIKTRILIYTTSLMMVVNVFLDYALIFGNFGFPEMGIKGAAIASVSSEVAAFLFFIVYTFIKIDLKKYGIFRFNYFDKAIFKRILSIANPIMLKNFISLCSWFIFFMIIEKIGEQELAISHILRSIYMVLMIPMFGFSSVTNTVVSNIIGRRDYQQVLPTIKKIVILGLSCTGILVLLNVFVPKQMISFYTDDPTLIKGALATLKVISVTMFVLTIASILFEGVTGTGNTKTALAIEVFNLTIYLILAYYIGITLKSSLPWVWSAELIYFTLLASFSFLYLKKGNWQKKEI